MQEFWRGKSQNTFNERPRHLKPAKQTKVKDEAIYAQVEATNQIDALQMKHVAILEDLYI